MHAVSLPSRRQRSDSEVLDEHSSDSEPEDHVQRRRFVKDGEVRSDAEMDFADDECSLDEYSPTHDDGEQPFAVLSPSILIYFRPQIHSLLSLPVPGSQMILRSTSDPYLLTRAMRVLKRARSGAGRRTSTSDPSMIQKSKVIRDAASMTAVTQRNIAPPTKKESCSLNLGKIKRRLLNTKSFPQSSVEDFQRRMRRALP